MIKMINQTSLIEFTILTPLIEVFFIIFLIILMIYLYSKMEGYWLMMITLMFSIIIGSISIYNFILPFTPYIQLFFMVFQLLIVVFKLYNLE